MSDHAAREAEALGQFSIEYFPQIEIVPWPTL
jgi:hypothetical protein